MSVYLTRVEVTQLCELITTCIHCYNKEFHMLAWFVLLLWWEPVYTETVNQDF